MQLSHKFYTSEHPIVLGDYIVPFNEGNRAIEVVQSWLLNDIKISVIYGECMTGLTTIFNSIYNYISQEIFSTKITANNSLDIYSELLHILGHSLYDLGTKNERLDRLVKFIIFKALKYNWTQIAVYIDESQNLSNHNIQDLIALQEALQREEITMYLILGISSELLPDILVKIKRINPMLISSINKYQYEIKGIQTEEDLRSILKWYDDISEYPSNSNCSYTRYFFPEAYMKGYRLMADSESLFKLFTSVYTTITHTAPINLPIGFIIQTIDTCFKYCGVLGEVSFWPTLDEWNKFMMDTRYINYLKLLY